MILAIYRFGSVVPVPFIDSALLRFSMEAESGGSIFQYMNILSGGAFAEATLFALSITPYITSSIVMQLLTVAIPALERLQQSGEEGRKVITRITRYVTILLGLITSFGYYMVLKNTYDVVTPAGETVFGAIVIISCYSAGTALIMWLGEKINESGIGNGISMILFANIISQGPSLAITVFNAIVNGIKTIINGATGVLAEGETAGGLIWNGSFSVVLTLLGLVATIAIVTFVVFITGSERRLPIQYAKRVVGRKMYGGQSTHLPIKLNMAGVMPIIFASSIVSIPATITQFVGTPTAGFWKGVVDFFSPNSIPYPIFFFLLIIAFSYFYIAISFNPIEVSNNLKKNGGSIPGVRPGKPTSDYISKILNKITLMGAFFLGIIAVLPLVANIASGGQLVGIAFGGSSLLIVIGVALETARDIEAQMTMRNYKGFLE
jgi:preprotein translocase subunit SecY